MIGQEKLGLTAPQMGPSESIVPQKSVARSTARPAAQTTAKPASDLNAKLERWKKRTNIQ